MNMSKNVTLQTEPIAPLVGVKADEDGQ